MEISLGIANFDIPARQANSPRKIAIMRETIVVSTVITAPCMSSR
uniref:Uncharacterized protein n=1 Tax=uncultured bacterium contig00062 TaxID=1181545 RepID=A0A806K160_9BACT|nr:hypothetical protein [uncultured bacterium contig00062]